MIVLDNYNEIFENAIKDGIFSETLTDSEYVGNFMYMFSVDERHYFKHKFTRRYGYDKETILNACKF